MSIINAGPSVGDLIRLSHSSDMELLDAKWADDGIRMLRDINVALVTKNALLQNDIKYLKLEIENLKWEIENGKPQTPTKMHEVY